MYISITLVYNCIYYLGPNPSLSKWRFFFWGWRRVPHASCSAMLCKLWTWPQVIGPSMVRFLKGSEDRWKTQVLGTTSFIWFLWIYNHVWFILFVPECSFIYVWNCFAQVLSIEMPWYPFVYLLFIVHFMYSFVTDEIFNGANFSFTVVP